MDRARARRQLVPALLSIATIAVAALAVWIPATVQHRASDRIYAQTTAIQGMLTSMLDQETGLRGYALTAQDVFLEPYRTGRRDFEAQFLDATRAAGGDGELRARVEAAETVARTWQADGDRAIEAVSGGDARRVVRTALERKAIMDRFRARITRAAELVDDRRGAQQSRAQTIPVVTVALVSALFLLIAYRVILRPRILSGRAGRRVRRYAEARQEFAVPGVERGVTASFGVAGMPEDAPEGAALLRQADRALYRAKELGRNRVESVAQPSASTA